MFTATGYQAKAIPAMIGGNFMLVWDPGTGKTYPVLVASQFVDGPTLCIVPAHLREQWLAQAREHVPLQRVKILNDTKAKIPKDLSVNYDLVIVSYEFVSVVPRWRELRNIRWGAIALDECHYLMNLDAKRSRAILGDKNDPRYGLVPAAGVVWPMSGTPFQFPNQIYPILSRLFPEAIERPARNGPGLMTAREWENEFCEVAEGDFGYKVVGAKNIPELRARLAPHLSKVKITDAIDLKPMIVDDIPIRGNLRDLTKGLDPEVLAAYEALTEILLDDDISDSEKLAALSESELVVAQVRHNIAVVKIQPTIEIIKAELETGVDKLIVFGWHKAPLKALAQELRVPIITGDTPPRRKEEAKDEFINNRKCQVLIGQISAVGTGTDGLQEVCCRELFMEASWAYRDNKQCLHRVYRKGQLRPCHASFITLLGSFDEYVNRVLKRNAEIVAKALD